MITTPPESHSHNSIKQLFIDVVNYYNSNADTLSNYVKRNIKTIHRYWKSTRDAIILFNVTYYEHSEIDRELKCKEWDIYYKSISEHYTSYRGTTGPTGSA